MPMVRVSNGGTSGKLPTAITNVGSYTLPSGGSFSISGCKKGEIYQVVQGYAGIPTIWFGTLNNATTLSQMKASTDWTTYNNYLLFQVTADGTVSGTLMHNAGGSVYFYISKLTY